MKSLTNKLVILAVLVALGVIAAPGALRRSQASGGAYRTVVNGSVQDSAAEAKAWVEENAALVDQAYRRFLEEGAWPDVLSLQQWCGRAPGEDIEVQAAVDAKPRVVYEAHPAHTDRLTLQVRHLMCWTARGRSSPCASGPCSAVSSPTCPTTTHRS